MTEKRLEWNKKIYLDLVLAARQSVRQAKKSSRAQDDSSVTEKTRNLTSYEKLALVYLYIKSGIRDTYVQQLCEDHYKFDDIKDNILNVIANTMKSKNLESKINTDFIKNKVLNDLLANATFHYIVQNQKFRPLLGNRVTITFDAKKISNKTTISFNFDSANYTLLAIAFKSMFSLIDERASKLSEQNF